PWHGHQLAGIEFQHPFLDLHVPAVLANYVTLDQGTGIVHTAPGHGVEDFQTGQKYGLETYAPLDDSGRYLEGLPEYKGKTVFEANPIVVALLRERGMLLGEAKLTHSYPHCWRCHNPVIFRATEQWFINLDQPGHGISEHPSGHDSGALRPRALAAIADVEWTPEWGEERIYSMIATRPDWCISRQRVWGVPLVIFYCDACGQRLEDFAALRHVVGWFEREGADAWYKHSAEQLLPPGTRCKCGDARWRKETDILDVWFDSGSSHLAVLDPPGTPDAELPWPADMYLEGPDQYRGWFHSSLLIGVAVRDGAPYRQVLTHGWTLDEHGRPMSKSLGNVVLPTEICEKWGADLLRLWVASQDYQSDVRMSANVMTQLSEAYRKVRNTFRFALSNLFDFDPARDAIPESEMEEIDRWMLQRTSQLVAEAEAFYQAFDFHRVYHALHDFCVVDLSAFYFDILKDRLYTFAPRGFARRSAQTAIYRIANALVRMLAPILVFTAEEIWKHLPRNGQEPDSVHLALFPKPLECRAFPDEALDGRWCHLRELRNEVLKALEQARAEKRISSGLEARVVLCADGTLGELLEQYAAWLPALFIVSQVEVCVGASSKPDAEGDGAPPPTMCSEELPGLTIEVRRADGAKCERCWTYSIRVGENSDYPTICERCVAALYEIDDTIDGASS
ncbi:MAG TPA: class I tRNA ligase family protein, partial [Candidatus Acidoferrales bacterium]